MKTLLLGLTLLAAGPRGTLDTKDMAAINALSTMVADSMNKYDAAAAAKHWAEDGTLSDPTGAFASGRGDVQKLFGTDFNTLFKGTRSQLTIQRVLPLSDTLAFVDVMQTVSGMKSPSGAPLPDQRIPVSVVVVKENNNWFVLHARTAPLMPPHMALD